MNKCESKSQAHSWVPFEFDDGRWTVLCDNCGKLPERSDPRRGFYSQRRAVAISSVLNRDPNPPIWGTALGEIPSSGA